MVINQTIGSFLKKHKLLVFFVVIIIFIIWMSYFYIGIKTSHKKNTNIIGVRFDDVVKQLEINTMHLASYRSLYSALSLNVPAEQILNQWKMHNEYVYTMVLLDQKKGFFSMSKIQETKAVNDSLYFQDLEWRALEYKNPTKIGDLSYTQYEVNEKKIVLFQREIKNNELVFGYLVAILDISKVFKNLKAQQHISKDIQFNISDSFHNKQCYLGSSILLKGYVCSEINLKYIITYIKDELLFVALTLFAGVLLGVFFVYIRSNKIRVATIYSLSSQVAHDIRSPLTALSIATSELKEVPEEKRLLIRSAVQRIEDIANDLSSKKAESLKVKSERTEEKETSIQLMSSIIERIVSEKRIQFRNKQEINIASKSNTESYGLFTKINTKEFKRVISNIINNAIEATDNNGAVKIKTTLEENNINIIVKDNGKGIPANVLPKLMNQGATFGKEKGQGLGLYHAKETIQSWGGNIKIESEIGKGTTVTLSLPKQPAPNWFLPELVVRENLIIILDDDESIHQVWNNRLKAAGIPKEAIKHFKDPYKLIFWYKSRDSLSIEDPEQSRRTTHAVPVLWRDPLFLCDYELLGSDKTGLQVIEELGIQEKAVLVTSHFEEDGVRKECAKLGVKLIPKNLAGFVPITTYKPQSTTHGSRSTIHAILIDDDDMNHSIWKMVAKKNNKNVALYYDPDVFFESISSFSKDTPIYIDSNLKKDKKGEEYAKEIYKKGFKNIYLATGDTKDMFENMPWIAGVVGKEPPFMSRG